jgi:hypothetical protein
VGHRGVSRIAACTVAVLCGLAVLATPARYEVDGVSMAPGLLPGDVVTTGWFPAYDRLRQPRRHERWILTSPDGSPAIKRVVGLPGETVSLRDGDLAIDGNTFLAPPQLLAEWASPVPEATIVAAPLDDADARWQRTVSLPSVFDDAEFAPAEQRMLLPVRDVGLAAVVHVRTLPPDNTAIRVRARVGDAVIPWRIKAAGRYAVVAGRLDGHLIGVAWPIAASDWRQENTRSCLPLQAPATWDIVRPWPASISSAGSVDDADDPPPALSLGILSAGMPLGRDDADAMIEHLAMWRDVLHRPAADGVVEWRLGADAFFVLGDFPSGSRDSRHWGPLDRRSLRSRATSLPRARGGSIKRL